jgi:hypothetical protein
MDFRSVLGFLIRDFQGRGIRYALMGGFAMGAWGIMRATMDLDFLVHRDDLPGVDAVMAAHGYRIANRSENVTQFASGLKPFGQVDFLHAFRPLAIGMLERARPLPIFDGTLGLPVLSPEDVIGLKVQASANDPSRLQSDTVDIALIAERFGSRLDWERVTEYFGLFGREPEATALRSKHAASDA